MKYGFELSREVRHCQPVVYDAGKVCVAGSGEVHPVPTGSTAGCDASSVAAGRLPLSVRQKLAANGSVGPPPAAVPSVR